MIYQKSNSKTSQYFECIRYKDFSFFEHMHRNPELIYVRMGEISVITELGKEVLDLEIKRIKRLYKTVEGDF